jgi:hypothetical protein
MNLVAELLRHAALMLEQRDRGRMDPVQQHGVGGATFCLLFEAAQQLYGTAAVAAMEKHLKTAQLQHAPQNADAMAVELRACADGMGESATADQVAGLLAELERVRDRLAAVLLINDPCYDLDACIQSIEGDYRTGDIVAAREAWTAEQPWPVPKPVRRKPIVDVPLPLELSP